MANGLDEETKRIVEGTLGRFVDEAYDPHARRLRLNGGAVDYQLHWKLLAQLGVLGLPFTEDEGGISGSAADVADALRVLARGLVLEPYIESAVVAGQLLAAGAEASGSSGSSGEISALVEGEETSVLVGGRAGVTERLVARHGGDGWRLSGKATAVMFAAEADIWLVAAQDAAAHEPVILRMRREDAQACIEPFRLLDGRRAADVTFSDVLLPGSSVWLSGAAAARALERAASHATSAYCADAVGCMTQLVSQTGEYLRTRVQFGVSLATFQALQHRFADMHMAMMESSAIARALAVSLDEDAPQRQRWLCFAASSVVTAAAKKIGHEAIQLHGGMGLTDELVVSHYNARLLTGTRLMGNMIPPDVTLPPLSSARAWL